MPDWNLYRESARAVRDSLLRTVIVLALGAQATSVSAGLIDQGDRTLDTATGRTWLDLTETTGCGWQVFADGLECNGYDTSAWTFASIESIYEFWANAGITALDSSTYSAADTAEIIALQGLVGVTNPLGGLGTFIDITNGYFAGPVRTSVPLFNATVQLAVDYRAPQSSRDLAFYNAGADETIIGAWIYQQAGGSVDVPVPSPLVLLAMGLIIVRLRTG